MPICNGSMCRDNPFYEAARNGRVFGVWVNELVPGTTDPYVITSGCVWNIPENARVFVTSALFINETDATTSRFEVVGCSAINGGGSATAASASVPVENTNKTEAAFYNLPEPGVATYSSGFRSISIRVTCENNTDKVTCVLRGFWEPE